MVVSSTVWTACSRCCWPPSCTSGLRRARSDMTFSKASVASTSPRSASQPRRLSILGSTGSIGCSTLDLVERNRDAFEVEVLTANRSVARLAMQAKRFGARLAVVADETARSEAHTSELQSLMRISYAGFCLNKTTTETTPTQSTTLQ